MGRLWLTCAWLQVDPPPTRSRKYQTFSLVSSSMSGELLRWEWTSSCSTDDDNDNNHHNDRSNLRSRSTRTMTTQNQRTRRCHDQTVKMSVFKHNHSRMVFNIAPLVIASREHPRLLSMRGNGEDAKDQDDNTNHESCHRHTYLLTISMDRDVRITDVQTMKCMSYVSGLGGHVYGVVVKTHPLPPPQLYRTIVAAGIGDNTIRVVDMRTPDQSTLLWKGLQSKVTALAWHPLGETVLGYGCEDGRFGYLNIVTQEHVRFKTCHSAMISHVAWHNTLSEAQVYIMIYIHTS